MDCQYLLRQVSYVNNSGPHFHFNSMKWIYVNRYQHPDHRIQPFFEIPHRNKTSYVAQKKNGTLLFTCNFFLINPGIPVLPFLQEARRVLELGGVLIFSTDPFPKLKLEAWEPLNEPLNVLHIPGTVGMGSGRVVVGLLLEWKSDTKKNTINLAFTELSRSASKIWWKRVWPRTVSTCVWYVALIFPKSPETIHRSCRITF